MTAAERDKELSLLQHLDELRRRLTVAAITVAIAAALSFTYAEHLIRLLLIPSGVTKCVALAPTENFATFMHVSLFAGIAFAMPVVLYEIYKYVDPALLPKERRFVLRLGPFVLALFVAGMAFCYFLLLPSALGFLTNIGGGVIDNQLRCAEYLSFVTTFILAMGIVFQMPAIIFVLVRVGIVKRPWLLRQRRFVFLGVFLLGALITPTPDPFNQALVALPMYLLFEFGLLISRFAVPRGAP
ncbi:MAG TPA: twin-arginine translocase subunit TatC [Candidatus Limnocylindria bacterium]|nr:twin-arginine translocase subunit TatC [Candidatus Limnocylindria bacterium]